MVLLPHTHTKNVGFVSSVDSCSFAGDQAACPDRSPVQAGLYTSDYQGDAGRTAAGAAAGPGRQPASGGGDPSEEKSCDGERTENVARKKVAISQSCH